MKHSSILFAGSVAALALAGCVAVAAYAAPTTHEMIVRLPGGGVERVEYSGDVAPRIVVNAAPFDMAWAMPMAFWPQPAFADFGRVMADMNRQMDAMVRQAEAMSAAPASGNPGAIEAAFGKMPAGATSYSMVTISNGHGVCTRTTETTLAANGAKPQTVSHQSGDCSGLHAAAPAHNDNTTAL